MAGTKDVLREMDKHSGTSYTVLVPNMRGLDDYLALIDEMGSPPAEEVAVFISASEEFSRANTNNTIAEALAAAEVVAVKARSNDLRVRGYVSVRGSFLFRSTRLFDLT
jgi:hydroxymethylglutaryl-CoA lyase